ncbi:MAG: GNAT family N-acetyltransferase [Cyclobacteriaceae bacterium]|nr:GNAT family N-acetyltransferase [Cyclobacteriaceae bacterium]MCH8517207.1 GNAT family N-acetyltransferase [Cyclobacteriaceae bacterium]
MTIKIERWDSRRIARNIGPLAEMRITVFREYPYLYDGDMDYESQYLERYIRAKDACVFAALDGDRLIGASSCIPLAQEDEEIQAPFTKMEEDLEAYFYFGESILLAPYRGQGLGKQFFHLREAEASSHLMIKKTTFCSVIRPEKHPLRAENYRSPRQLWKSMGYQVMDRMLQLNWKDVGENKETTKRLQFYEKTIR